MRGRPGPWQPELWGPEASEAGAEGVLWPESQEEADSLLAPGLSSILCHSSTVEGSQVPLN